MIVESISALIAENWNKLNSKIIFKWHSNIIYEYQTRAAKKMHAFGNWSNFMCKGVIERVSLKNFHSYNKFDLRSFVFAKVAYSNEHVHSPSKNWCSRSFVLAEVVGNTEKIPKIILDFKFLEKRKWPL